MSYARLILSACSKDQLPAGMTTPLPPRHLAMLTIQHYMDNLFVLLPFFDEASLYYSLEAVYQTGAGLGRSGTPFDHWCVRMVLAVANASLSEQRGDQNYMEGVGHVNAALKEAEQVLIPGTMSTVQALLFLVQYALMDPHHFDSWGLVGTASRAMVDLGLHQDPPKARPVAKPKLEMRRRLFHCVFVMDRSTSIVQTRAFSFSDDSANVSASFVSSRSSHGAAPLGKWTKNLDQATALIGLRKIQSAWYTSLFQSGRKPWNEPYVEIWRFCQELADWKTSLPKSTSPQLRDYFELDLLYSYIYLLAPSPRVPVIAALAQKLIFEYCIAYAELMTRLVRDGDRKVPMDFYDAMRVYMTGRQFLDVLANDQDRLLSGEVPDPPPISRTSAAPPPMAFAQTDSHTNLTRSVACIKQLTECLGHFGLRWGYMSWRDRFQKDAEPTVVALTQRMWALQESTTSARRPEWYHASSTGSLGSEGGRSTHLSPYSSQQHSMYGSPSATQPYVQQPYSQPYQSPPIDYDLQQPAQQFSTWHALDTADGTYKLSQTHADGAPDDAAPDQ